MIKALKNIFTNKHAIIWTVGYIFISWAILYFLFNFNIFNTNQWHHLMNARLHGFAGFVFGILILSALPLYIATTILIIRKNNPLITIPIPKITLPGLSKNKGNENTPEPQPELSEPATVQKNPELPSELPRELHSAFLRARENAILFQRPGQTTSNTNEANNEAIPIMEALPLPSDFDISFDDTPGFIDDTNASIPTFTDINFDDTPNTPTFEPDTQDTNNDIYDSKLVQHLLQNNITFDIDQDIVLTPKYAIAIHEDNDFWATDDTNWFASGKVRPSPINAVKNCAPAHNLRPAIYLGATNILDIDELISDWESDGITVITDLNKIE